MAKTWILNFEHTGAGMNVWFLDHHGTWLLLEQVAYMRGPVLDAGREELDYVGALRACRPDMAVDVRQYRLAA